jgi:Domain of unknown function (DUF6438)
LVGFSSIFCVTRNIKMKILVKLCVYLFLLQSCSTEISKGTRKQNKIDSLQNEKEVSRFLIKVDTSFSNFIFTKTIDYRAVFPSYRGINYKKISDSLNIKAWQKGDFDANGLTDLLVIGRWNMFSIICILDKGLNNYELKPIERNFWLPHPFPLVQNNKISYHHFNHEQIGHTNKLEKVNLVYKFNTFIEENKRVNVQKIDTIEFSSLGCYGYCPVLKMVITDDRDATWINVEGNDSEQQEVVYKTKITKKNYDEIINVLNYINFRNLKDEYFENEDALTLKITYNRGKVKNIRDNGNVSTFGLQRLYQILLALHENQKWNKLSTSNIITFQHIPVINITNGN